MAGKKFTPDQLDQRVGKMIMILRKQQGLSQKDLANAIGITFQQLQKYEAADNRMSVSRFYNILKILGVSFNQVFCELDKGLLRDPQLNNAADKLWQLPADDRQIVYAIIDRLYRANVTTPRGKA